MITKKENIFAELLICSLIIASYNVYGSSELNARVSVVNKPPEIVSVKTYSQYLNYLNNRPDTVFSYPDNQTVYVQIHVRDGNGYKDIVNNGFVKARIVLWNTLTERDFTRFGASYLPAEFETALNDQEALYTYMFVMDAYDPDRLGNETPPRYYRVKAQVSDGSSITISTVLNSSQNADYTYDGNGTAEEEVTPPAPPSGERPPFPVIFDVRIDVPENNRILYPGDPFYASVSIIKLSPPGQAEIRISYKITDPENKTQAYMSESMMINYSLYRIPVLYIPVTASGGLYIFTATVSLGGVDTWAATSFHVVGPTPSTSTTTSTSTTSTTETTPPSTTSTTTSTSMPQPTTTRPAGRVYLGDEGVESLIAPIIRPLELRQEISFYKYPAEVSGFPGESKTLVVSVDNPGNITLEDVSVYMAGPVEIKNIVPEKIPLLEPGVRRVFAINYRIPENLKPGEYDITLKAIARQTYDERYVRLLVLEKPKTLDIESQIGNEIEDLNNVLIDLWNIVVEIGITEEDKTVSEVFKILRSAKESLENAKKNLKEKKYDKSREYLDKAHEYIETAVINLSMLRSEKPKVEEHISTREVTVYTLPPIYWAVVAVVMAASFFLLYDRLRAHGLTKRLRERYELQRMRDLILGRSFNRGGLVNARTLQERHDMEILKMLREKMK